MIVSMQESLGNVSNQEINRYESKLEIGFPQSYRAFLLQYNGGMPEPALFTVRGWGTTLVNSFFWYLKE